MFEFISVKYVIDENRPNFELNGAFGTARLQSLVGYEDTEEFKEQVKLKALK